MDVTIGAAVEFRDAGGRLFATYHYDDPYKPFFRSLCTPSDRDVVAVPAPDHLHHKGLQYGLCAEDVNFWEEDAASEPARRRIGLQVTESLERLDGTERTGFTQQLIWRDGVCVSFRETRTISVSQTSPAAYRWIWRTVLTAQRDLQLAVSAWPQQGGYCGLGLRLAPELFLRKSSTVSMPEGAGMSGSMPTSIAVHGARAGITFEQDEQRDVLFIRGCDAGSQADYAFLSLGPTNGSPRSLKNGDCLVGLYAVTVEER